jgi:hypothetical protein
MHYLGMAATRGGCVIHYSRLGVFISVLIAVQASGVALWFTFRQRGVSILSSVPWLSALLSLSRIIREWKRTFYSCTLAGRVRRTAIFKRISSRRSNHHLHSLQYMPACFRPDHSLGEWPVPTRHKTDFAKQLSLQQPNTHNRHRVLARLLSSNRLIVKEHPCSNGQHGANTSPRVRHMRKVSMAVVSSFRVWLSLRLARGSCSSWVRRHGTIIGQLCSVSKLAAFILWPPGAGVHTRPCGPSSAVTGATLVLPIHFARSLVLTRNSREDVLYKTA